MCGFYSGIFILVVKQSLIKLSLKFAVYTMRAVKIWFYEKCKECYLQWTTIGEFPWEIVNNFLNSGTKLCEYIGTPWSGQDVKCNCWIYIKKLPFT